MDFQAVADGKEPTETQLIPIKPMDLEGVTLNLKAAFDGPIDALVETADKHEVSDDDTEKAAIEMAAAAKRLNKDLETERKAKIAEPDKYVRGLNGLCRGFKDRLAQIESGLKKKISNHQWKKELERRKKERAAEELAAKLRKQAEKEAKKAKVELPPVEIVPVVEKKETVTRTDSGASAHIRTSWKMTEIVDFKKVPDEYKEINTKQVNAAIKAGTLKIPGLKIEEVPDVALRV